MSTPYDHCVLDDRQDPRNLARAVDWARGHMGWGTVSIEPLRGGWTSTMLLLRADDDDETDSAVLRVMTKEPWRTDATQLLEREAQVQAQLAESQIPAPHSLALDSQGVQAGRPAHLMTYLPGRVDLTRTGGPTWTELARVLHSIHDYAPDPRQRPRTFQSWAPPAKRVVPTWSTRTPRWERAFALLECTAPPTADGTFLHRDFHLGNVLWQDDRISGVVDWVETSWGPPRLDVAHAATYIAMVHGQAAATDFETAYAQHDDSEPGARAGVYWDVMDIVGYLPDPTKVVQPWRELGRVISDELARQRLEERLSVVLARG